MHHTSIHYILIEKEGDQMNAAVAEPSNCCTIQDIYNLPEGQRAELIDGVLYRMAAPDRIHQELVTDFTYLIKDYIKNKKR